MLQDPGVGVDGRVVTSLGCPVSCQRGSSSSSDSQSSAEVFGVLLSWPGCMTWNASGGALPSTVVVGLTGTLMVSVVALAVDAVPVGQRVGAIPNNCFQGFKFLG